MKNDEPSGWDSEELKSLERLKRYNVEIGIQQAIGCRWAQEAQTAQEGGIPDSR
jgi:hypothetical protein